MRPERPPRGARAAPTRHTEGMAKRRSPLEPVEIATAGILSGLTVALGLLGSALPLFSLLFQVAAAVPIAMLASRMRTRAGLSALVVSILMSAGVGGLPTAWAVAKTSLVGWVVGSLHRKKTGAPLVGLAALGVGVAGGAFTWGMLSLLEESRELLLDSTRTSMNGYLSLLERVPALAPAAASARSWLEILLAHWWAWIPASSGFGLSLLALGAYWLLTKVLKRIDPAREWDPLLAAPRPAEGASCADAPSATPTRAAGIGPLPLRLERVSFTYPGAEEEALRDVSLEIDRGFTVVLGPNGSGKSTLALLLAGASPSSGTAERPGRAGLGEAGGTALVAQRSEVQFLGETLAEDLAWGLSAEEREGLDMEGILSRVGLAGLEGAQTRRLSGGQLQRLALAGALARRPALLVSDESTAMIDPAGRAHMMRILKELAEEGTAVVHITHDPLEAASADRVIRLENGRIVEDSHDAPPPAGPRPRSGAIASRTGTPAPIRADAGPGEAEHLWARGVGHSYDPGTPWEHEVLSEVTFFVSPGQSVLITGENGSGKSTLARILTGLMTPTRGRCTLGSRPVHLRLGEVALSRQFARLQLQRPKVGLDILAAAGFGPSVGTAREGAGPRGGAAGSRGGGGAALDPAQAEAFIARALAEVGLDPSLAGRNVDELSGGQQRRVVLAGLLASSPKAIVLDEPLAGLDAPSREILVQVLNARRAAGLGIVLISHDVDGLESLCDQRLHLAKGVLA